MKYWRGYLVALIIAAGAWGLQEFAKSHPALIDMVYPYSTRIFQTYLAQWSSNVDFCVWQVVRSVGLIAALASVVVMIVIRGNPVRLFGWILAVISLFNFATTAAYGLNYYSGPLAEDVRLEDAEYAYSVPELEKAAAYYREFANAMSNQIERDSDGNPIYDDFDTLSVQAAEGFDTLVNERHYPIFAGSTVPVKKLELNGDVTELGKTVPLTGEASVDPTILPMVMPFAMNREMARRMCIAIDRDADFAAFMACDANSSLPFRYCGYFLAYRSCYKALESICESTGDMTPLRNLESGEASKLKADIAMYEDYFGDQDCFDPGFCDVLVSWHVQTVVLPQMEEEEQTFDPLDETQVDLNGIVNATP